MQPYSNECSCVRSLMGVFFWYNYNEVILWKS
nr:MAG TPA: hypothetical protein [Caudoviricetes sp.]